MGIIEDAKQLEQWVDDVVWEALLFEDAAVTAASKGELTHNQYIDSLSIVPRLKDARRYLRYIIGYSTRDTEDPETTPDINGYNTRFNTTRSRDSYGQVDPVIEETQPRSGPTGHVPDGKGGWESYG